MLYPLSYRPKRGLADTSEEPQTCTVVKAGVRDRFFRGRIVRRFRCRLGIEKDRGLKPARSVLVKSGDMTS